MYYSKFKKLLRVFVHYCILPLIFALSFIANQLDAFAKDQTPQDSKFRILGYKEQQKGNFDEALSHYFQALTENPNQANVLNDIAVIYEQLGVMDKAEEFYLKAIAVNEHYLPSYMNLALLYEGKGNMVDAVDFLRKRVSLGDPADPWTSRAQQELDQIYKAFPVFKKSVIQAQAEELTGELVQKAREEFEAAVKSSQEHYQKGNELVQQKSYQEAVTEFDTALTFTPDNPNVIEARNRARALVARDNTQSLYDHALQMVGEGDRAAAKEEIQKILAIISDEPIQTAK